MRISRRTLLATASAALLAPRGARAATVIDDAGRSVTVPGKVHRVFPAGPAAAILLYTLASERLLAWPRANRPQATRDPELEEGGVGGVKIVDVSVSPPRRHPAVFGIRARRGCSPCWPLPRSSSSSLNAAKLKKSSS